MIKNNKEEGGKPLIGTKAFTVINQIYIQFIQMFNLQQKYKKKKNISQDAKLGNKFIGDTTDLPRTDRRGATRNRKVISADLTERKG